MEAEEYGRGVRWLWVTGLLLLGACSAGDDPRGEDGSPPPTASAPSAAADELLLHEPPGDGERALVLVFHGSPGSPEIMAAETGFDAVADRHGFLVAYPSTYLDLDELRALIDRLVDEEEVDPRRIYAAGFSRGASRVYELVAEMPDTIAAFAPVSGIPYGDFAPSRAVPLLAVQGARDDLAPAFPDVNREWVEVAGCRRPSVRLVRVGGRLAQRSTADCDDRTTHVVYHVAGMGHVWPKPASELIWAFFDAQRLPD